MNCLKVARTIFLLFLVNLTFTNGFGQSKYPSVELKDRTGDFSGIVYDFCFSKSGRTLVYPESNVISFYDLQSKALIGRLNNGHSKPVLAIALSVDSSLLVSGGLDSTIVMWNVQSGKVSKKLDFHHGVITTLNLNSGGTLLASGSSDKTVVVYDLAGEKIVFKITDLPSDVTVVRFSPDGQLLAVGSQDKTIRLYNSKTGQLIVNLEGHKNCVRDICFNNDGTRLFSCGDDSKLLKWDIRNLNLIKKEEIGSYGSDWLLSVDVRDDAWVVAGLDSKINVVTNFETYRGKVGVAINKIKFIPNSGSFLKFAVATRGKGLFLVDSMDFGY
jgi:WD40 repeat protein